MTSGRYYSIAMPLAGVLFAILLIAVHSGVIILVATMLFAVIAIGGLAFRGRRAP